jgi:hypothetical protein
VDVESLSKTAEEENAQANDSVHMFESFSWIWLSPVEKRFVPLSTLGQYIEKLVLSNEGSWNVWVGYLNFNSDVY